MREEEDEGVVEEGTRNGSEWEKSDMRVVILRGYDNGFEVTRRGWRS